MVEKDAYAARNVIDFLGYQQGRKATALSSRCCKHCGAGLLDGESEDDCSSAGVSVPDAKPRRFYAE
jgi:hypothetical protein